MKKKTKINKIFICLLIICFSMFSCEVEKDFQKTTTIAKINHVKIEDVPFLIPTIQNFNHSYDYLTNSSFNPEKLKTLNLNLDLENIIEYVYGNGLKTYSIKINKEFQANEDKYFENLHIYKVGMDFKSFVLKYNEIDDTKIFDLSTFTGDLEIFDINYVYQGVVQFENGERKCHKIIHGGWHIWIHNGTIDVWFNEQDANASSGSDNNNDEDPSGFLFIAATPPPIGGNEGSGGGGFSNNTNVNEFLNLLNSEEIEIIQLNPEMILFLEENNASIESQEMVREFILQITRGGKIDFENKIIIDSTFASNQKAMCVYNKMKNNQGFKTFTEPFNINNPVAFVKLKAGVVQDNDRAQTLPPDSKNIIEITINNNPSHPNGINGQPNLFLCQTIIHEIIHAEFFRRIIEALGSNPSGVTLQTIIDALSKSKYQILANYLISSNVWPDWSHNLMAEKFRRSIARVTQEFATGIPVLGNPDDIYMYYAWRGLDQIDVESWLNLPQSTRTGIQNTIDNYESTHLNQICE